MRAFMVVAGATSIIGVIASSFSNDCFSGSTDKSRKTCARLAASAYLFVIIGTIISGTVILNILYDIIPLQSTLQLGCII